MVKTTLFQVKVVVKIVIRYTASIVGKTNWVCNKVLILRYIYPCNNPDAALNKWHMTVEGIIWVRLLGQWQ